MHTTTHTNPSTRNKSRVLSPSEQKGSVNLASDVIVRSLLKADTEFSTMEARDQKFTPFYQIWICL